METAFKTKSVDERNEFITDCYRKNIQYVYHDINKEGDYIVEIKDNNYYGTILSEN